MNLPEHNPGPWSVIHGGGRNASLLTVVDAAGFPVASMRRQYRIDKGRPVYDDYRRLNNADLMAAAPELAAAIADYLSGDMPSREGLRRALERAMGIHPPVRYCGCQQCFEYFYDNDPEVMPPPYATVPPLMQGVE